MMFNKRLFGLIVSIAALAAGAASAAAATPNTPDPHSRTAPVADGVVLDLQMPGASTWGNYAPPAPREPLGWQWSDMSG
jgi:hypothetical protein